MSGDAGQPAVSLLDLERVLPRVAAGIARPLQQASARQTAAAPVHAEYAAAETRTLVSFEADGEEYAVPVPPCGRSSGGRPKSPGCHMPTGITWAS